MLRFTAAALQDDLKNFRWHHVDPFHFDDNKFYGPALNIPFNGQLVEAGSVFPLDSLLAALLGDFGQLLAGDMQLLNFTNEQRAEVGFSSVFCVTVAACVYVYLVYCLPAAEHCHGHCLD